jgi:hypothetical protein
MKLLEIVVTVIGILFVSYVIYNLRIPAENNSNNIDNNRSTNINNNRNTNRNTNINNNVNNRNKEDFEIDINSCEPSATGKVDCPMTESRFNSLKAKWDNYVTTQNPEDIASGYATDISALSNQICNKAGQCYDDDVGVETASTGDYPSCSYVKQLFGVLDLDNEHDSGFGALSGYCPHSLNVPGAQVCLRKVRATVSDIKTVTDEHRQYLVDEITKENDKLSTSIDALKENIDKKLERDYVKYYLNHHKKYDNAIKDFRKGELEFSEVENARQLPKIREPSENNDDSGTSMEGSTVDVSPLFGNYLFDVPHTREILRNVANNELNMQVTEADIDALLSANIVFDNSGMFIQYADDTEPNGLIFDKVIKVPNPKSEQEGYQISGAMGTYELYPDTELLYVKVIMTGNILPTQFLKDMTYLLTKA